MPFPSWGCQTCKLRRIKCDETKPICQRCAKSQRICFEPRTVRQASFSIHVENRYASGKSKRPRGPRSSLTVLRPQVDLQTQALAYYFQRHLQTRPEVPTFLRGLTDCMLEWKASKRSCPMVDLGLASMALAIFAYTHKHAPAATEASKSYHRLLRHVQVALPALNEQNIDSYLLAVALMGRYEGATHRPGDYSPNLSFTSMRSWLHHDGAMAILRIWNDSLSHYPSTSIIRQTRRGLIRSYLLRNLPLPDWIMDGDRFGEHGAGLAYDRIIVRIVSLHCVSKRLQQDVPQSARTEQLASEARDLDQELKDWAANLPSTWSYQRHVLTGSEFRVRHHFSSSVVYSFSRPGYGAVWCHYFAMRMLINATRLRILEMYGPKSSVESILSQQLDCFSQLKQMADDLAATIPFCLERLQVAESRSLPTRREVVAVNIDEEIKPHRVNLVVWPLTIASSLKEVDATQRVWFRSELTVLGRKTVLEWAETDQWAIL